MEYPETDPATYEGWIKMDWHELILLNLTEVLRFVRVHSISGLGVGKIRSAVFVPFGGPEMFNRKASLLLAEIEAYQSRWKSPINEKKFDREYQLSGLRRP